jgi:DNA-binding CsgD family transcriptional regulator
VGRENRRQDARRQLGAAHELFDGFGAGAFAERARREPLATGQTARRRTADALSLLTAQEAQIARPAGDGLTNPGIGAQLFIGSRTVAYHLRKIFPKLDISSRARNSVRLWPVPERHRGSARGARRARSSPRRGKVRTHTPDPVRALDGSETKGRT